MTQSLEAEPLTIAEKHRAKYFAELGQPQAPTLETPPSSATDDSPGNTIFSRRRPQHTPLSSETCSLPSTGEGNGVATLVTQARSDTTSAIVPYERHAGQKPVKKHHGLDMQRIFRSRNKPVQEAPLSDTSIRKVRGVGIRDARKGREPVGHRLARVLAYDHWRDRLVEERAREEGRTLSNYWDADLEELEAERGPQKGKPKAGTGGSIFSRTMNALSGQERVWIQQAVKEEEKPEERLRRAARTVVAAAKRRADLRNRLPVIGSSFFRGLGGRDSALVTEDGLNIFEQGAPRQTGPDGQPLRDDFISFEDIAAGRVEVVIDSGGRTPRSPRNLKSRVLGAVGTVVVKHKVLGEYHFIGVHNPGSVIRELYDTALAFAKEDEAKEELRQLRYTHPELFDAPKLPKTCLNPDRVLTLRVN